MRLFQYFPSVVMACDRETTLEGSDLSDQQTQPGNTEAAVDTQRGIRRCPAHSYTLVLKACPMASVLQLAFGLKMHHFKT